MASLRSKAKQLVEQDGAHILSNLGWQREFGMFWDSFVKVDLHYAGGVSGARSKLIRLHILNALFGSRKRYIKSTKECTVAELRTVIRLFGNPDPEIKKQMYILAGVEVDVLA